MTRAPALPRWPESRLAEAVEVLARLGGLNPVTHATAEPPPELAGGDVEAWLDVVAANLNVRTEALSVSLSEVDGFVRSLAPTLVALEREGRREWLVLLGRRRTSALVVTPEGGVTQTPCADVATALAEPFAAELERSVESVVRHLPEARRSHAGRALGLQQQGDKSIGRVFAVLPRLDAPLAQSLGAGGALRLAALLICARAFETALVVASFWAAARGAFEGRFDAGWLLLWALLLVCVVPCRWGAGWAQSHLSVVTAATVKRRLLAGTLALPPEALRRSGAGDLLGRVIESAVALSMGTAGSLAAVLSLVELAVAAILLVEGGAGSVHCTLLALSTGAIAVVGATYLRARRRWTTRRIQMTHDLVERMVGHRTRLAQELRARWHDGEDEALERYLAASKRLDVRLAVVSLLPQAWVFAAVAALAVTLLEPAVGLGELGASLGGILLAEGALATLVGGTASLAGALVSWSLVADHFRAPRRDGIRHPNLVVSPPGDVVASRAPLLMAENLAFRYAAHGPAVLEACGLQVRRGDRLLLEGRSGGGKSTLGALLSGLRAPTSGLLLLDGVDRASLGEDGWRRRVVAAPQFHENHVFSAPLAFNLLLGRQWPPEPNDLAEADEICRELGLGPLLDRMPGGLQQMVGETGWQLSHGEKSRVYIARALLQGASFVVLDESFAALDPETLEVALRCVLRRAPTLLVIAHP